MRLPVVQGLIRRRLLVNFRVDPDVVTRLLPAPFRPKLHDGFAIAGICLIRLEQIRPAGFPAFLGMSSENAAHRIAVCWEDSHGAEREGVFIPRRDTGSEFVYRTGGRLFPGEHHKADFRVSDADGRISIDIRARDDDMRVRLAAQETDSWPTGSCFASLAESSAFFEAGSIGYSVTRDCCRLDGLQLTTRAWKVSPLAVDDVDSSFFADESMFPGGSVHFDHALVMRDIPHEWHAVEDMIATLPERTAADSKAAQPCAASGA